MFWSLQWFDIKFECFSLYSGGISSFSPYSGGTLSLSVLVSTVVGYRV